MYKILPIILVVVLSGCGGNTKTTLEKCADFYYAYTGEGKTFHTSLERSFYEDIVSGFKNICKSSISGSNLINKVHRCKSKQSCSPDEFNDIDSMISKSFNNRTYENINLKLETFGHRYSSVDILEENLMIIKKESNCSFSSVYMEPQFTSAAMSNSRLLYNIEMKGASRLEYYLKLTPKQKLWRPDYEEGMSICESKQERAPKTFDAKWK